MADRPLKPKHIAVLVVALVWLCGIAFVRHTTVAGDPYAVYFPIVRGLWSGDGLYGFAATSRGVGRMAGFPFALAVAAAPTPDLFRAAQLVGITSAGIVLTLVLWVMRRAQASFGLMVLAVFAIATNPTFVRSAMEPLPDMLCCALIGGFVVVLRHSLVATPGSNGRWILLSGALAALAFSVRFNAAALLPAGLVAMVWVRKKLPWSSMGRMFAGFVIGLAPQLLVTLVLASRRVWAPVIALQGLASKKTGASAVIPSLLTGVFDFPLRIANTLSWPLAISGLVALVALLVVRRKPIDIVIGSTIFAMLGLLIPVHYEARYYLWIVPIIVPLAFLGLWWGWTRTRLPPSIGAICVVVMTVVVVFQQLKAVRTEVEWSTRWEKDARAFCAEMANATANDPQLVAGRDFYLYSRVTGCPVPTVEWPRQIVVPANKTDPGIELVVEKSAKKSAPTIVRNQLGVLSAAPQLELQTQTSSKTSLLASRWSMDFPRHRRTVCQRRKADLPPGRYQVGATIESTPAIAARMVFEAGPRVVQIWGAKGQSAMGGPWIIEEGVSPVVMFCIADPTRRAGTIEATAIWASPLGDE